MSALRTLPPSLTLFCPALGTACLTGFISQTRAGNYLPGKGAMCPRVPEDRTQDRPPGLKEGLKSKVTLELRLKT